MILRVVIAEAPHFPETIEFYHTNKVIAENGVPSFARITAEDSFIATGPAYAATLPAAAGIVRAAATLAKG